MNTVTLMPNPYRDSDFQITRQILDSLRKLELNVRLCFPFYYDAGESDPALRFISQEAALKGSEAIICIGGDGTFLHTAKLAARRNIPILGINAGTVGFLSELEPTRPELLSGLKADEYGISRRMMLQVDINRGGKCIYRDIYLNDSVITKGVSARVIQPCVHVDDLEAMSFTGDGIIISTPTGATGYSLSAGGPVIEPSLDCIAITPLYSHSLRQRSMVVGPDKTITIRLKNPGKRGAYLSVDGGRSVRLYGEDEVVITRSKLCVDMLQLTKSDFFHTLHHKLEG